MNRVLVNDVHSRLNDTAVDEVVEVGSLEETERDSSAPSARARRSRSLAGATRWAAA